MTPQPPILISTRDLARLEQLLEKQPAVAGIGLEALEAELGFGDALTHGEAVALGCAALCGAMVCGLADYLWNYPRVMCIFWFVFALTIAGAAVFLLQTRAWAVMIGVLAALLSLNIFGAENFVLPCMLLIICILFVSKKKLEGSVSEKCR